MINILTVMKKLIEYCRPLAVNKCVIPIVMESELKRIEHPNFQVAEEFALNIANVTQHLFDEVRRQEEELFTTALRVMAEPPIKGEITKGKIRWRGIRLIRQQVGLDSYSWLEQRGKQLSPKFHIEVKLPDLTIG